MLVSASIGKGEQGWIQTSATSFQKLVKFCQTLCPLSYYLQIIKIFSHFTNLAIFLHDNLAKCTIF